MIGPVGRLSLVACAITIGGSIWALWDLGSFMGLRYGLEGFAGLQAFDPVFIANSDINPLEPGFGPWFQPGLASWLATAGFVLFVASIGLGAALWRPRPRVAREAATVEVTD